MYVAEENRDRISVLSLTTGALLRRLGSDGDGDGEFRSPVALAVRDGSAYVLDSSTARLQEFRLD